VIKAEFGSGGGTRTPDTRIMIMCWTYSLKFDYGEMAHVSSELRAFAVLRHSCSFSKILGRITPELHRAYVIGDDAELLPNLGRVLRVAARAQRQSRPARRAP
jgi:hypothetical protein